MFGCRIVRVSACLSCTLFNFVLGLVLECFVFPLVLLFSSLFVSPFACLESAFGSLLATVITVFGLDSPCVCVCVKGALC